MISTYPNESRPIEAAIVDDVPCHDRYIHCSRRRIICRRSPIKRRSTSNPGGTVHVARASFVRRGACRSFRRRRKRRRVPVRCDRWVATRLNRKPPQPSAWPRRRRATPEQLHAARGATLDFVGRRGKPEPNDPRPIAAVRSSDAIAQTAHTGRRVARSRRAGHGERARTIDRPADRYE